MKIFHDFFQPIVTTPTTLTIGMFDGVHMGHQHLIRSVVESAHSNGRTSGLVTFFPHPRRVIGCSGPEYLTSTEEKIEILNQLGLDFVVLVNFTLEVSKIPAAHFVNLLVENLNMKELCIGHDFALGYQREGNEGFLYSRGVELGFSVYSITNPLTIDGQLVSSSCIREALQAGDIQRVNAFLGRQFRITGIVEPCTSGNKFHDANVVRMFVEQDHAKPKDGLYIARINFNRISYDAITEFKTYEFEGKNNNSIKILLPEHTCDINDTICFMDIRDRLFSEPRVLYTQSVFTSPLIDMIVGSRFC